MATIAVKLQLFKVIDDWAAVAAPIAARDPSPYFGSLGVSDMAGAVARLRSYAERYDDALATRLVNSEITQNTAWLNQIFGTSVVARGFQVPPVTPLSTAPEPTPEEVATFGTGVDFSEINPDLIEEAAALDPASLAASYLADGALGEPFPPAPLITIEDRVIARREIQIPATDAPLQLFTERDMPFHGSLSDPIGIDGGFDLPFGGPPLTPPPTISAGGDPGAGGFDFTGALERLLGGISRGDPLVSVLLGGLGGGIGLDLPISDTNDQVATPPTTQPPLPGVAPDLQARFLEFLKAFPPTALTTQFVSMLWNMFGGTGDPPPVSTPGIVGTSQTRIGLNGQIGLNGLMADGCDVQTLRNTQIKQVHTAPKGFVVVECIGSNGLPVKMAMWKPLAIKLGKWRASRKPPMSAAEWRTLKTAERVKNKVKRIAGAAGFKTEVKGRARRRPAAVCK